MLTHCHGLVHPSYWGFSSHSAKKTKIPENLLYQAMISDCSGETEIATSADVGGEDIGSRQGMRAKVERKLKSAQFRISSVEYDGKMI